MENLKKNKKSSIFLHLSVFTQHSKSNMILKHLHSSCFYKDKCKNELVNEVKLALCQISHHSETLLLDLLWN